ncbi:MAG: kelch repeat-containing protein [Casimicrobiaceae bacterium]
MTLWVRGSATTPKARLAVGVSSASPAPAYSSQVVLNPDPTAAFVTNTDGTAQDLANDNLGAVVLSNAVLTNNALSNNALSNNVLSNNALTNAVLSNVVLSNAVLSNLDPSNAAITNALSNDALTNAVLSNVVLSNAALSNNVLSNNVLSNVVLSNVVLSNVALSNTAINAPLTNLDPANVALSNAVLSNNALTNVVLSNLDPTNALSNAVLSNNVLSNAVLSNVALSNAALSNNALSNNALSNVVLSNSPLGDPTDRGDPNALRSIEVASTELANTAFTPADLGNSNFRDTTFTIRNRGNTDTTLSFKMLLSGAICNPTTHVCTTPPGYTLQLVIRKVAFVPVAIPPTTVASTTGNAVRIGLLQTIADISNVGSVPIIDPNDPTLGASLPFDPKAATISLAPGERAYVTLRAIATGDSPPPDPAELLQWGVKPLGADASGVGGPFAIRTLSFADDPNRRALASTALSVLTLGGVGPVSGTATCTDRFGNTVLDGTSNPGPTIGAVGNYFINTVTETLFGPKQLSGDWGPGTDLIVGRNTAAAQAFIACPPPTSPSTPAIGLADDGTSTRTARLSFTPKYWGDFYVSADVLDGSAPPQQDRQVLKVTIHPAVPVITFQPNFPTIGQFKLPLDLRTLVANGAITSTSPTPLTFSTANVPGGNACYVDTDGYTLQLASASPPNCIFNVSQVGNETYAPITQSSPAIFIVIQRADQVIAFAVPVDDAYAYQQGPIVLGATLTSPTAPDSGLPVTFTSTTPMVCATGGTNGTMVSIIGAGLCTIDASAPGNHEYNAPPQVEHSFNIRKADQNLAFPQVVPQVFQQAFGAPVGSSSPTAAPSTIPIVVASTTPAVCTVNGTTLAVLAAGDCGLTATQGGDSNYNPAPQQAQVVVIQKANQAISFPQITPRSFNQSFSAVATSSSLTAIASGIPIVFASTTPSICTVSGNTVSALAAGACALTADQAGNGNYNAAPQQTQSVTIQKADQALTFGPPPSSPTFGDPAFTVSATSASPTAPPPTDPPLSLPVVFTVPVTTTICSVSGNSVTILAAGLCTVEANQAGDANYNVAPPKSLDVTIAKAKFNLTATVTPTTIVYGDDVDPAPKTLVTYGFSYASVPAAASCLTGTTADMSMSGQPTASPADAGVYTITPAITPAAVLASCDVVPITAQLTVSPAPLAFTIAPIYFTPYTSPTTASTIAGTVHRADKPSIFSTDPVTIAIVAPASSDPATPAGPDGAFTLDKTLETGSYQLAFTQPVTGMNFIAPTAAQSTLRVEGFVAAGSMTEARARHTATLLADGRVLIAGGFTGVPQVVRSTVEIYCPDTMSSPSLADCPAGTGVFSTMAPLATAAEGHTATRLVNGTVLKVGGRSNQVELFDPLTNTWSTRTPLPEARTFHTATLLVDGRVMIAGGQDAAGATLDTTLVFAADGSGYTPGPLLTAARESHDARLLGDGRVLLAGGRFNNGSGYTVLASAEIYDPAATTCPPSIVGCTTATGSMAAARFASSAASLADGRIVVAGGLDGSMPTATLLATAEVFSPVSGTWTAIGTMSQARRSFALVRLFDDSWLASGGFGTSAARVTPAESLDPDLLVFDAAGDMLTARARHRATRLLDGRVLITGGTIDDSVVPGGSADTAIGNAELYLGPPPPPPPGP